MAFTTNAFGLFYKRLGPTGSNINVLDILGGYHVGYLPEFWYTASITGVSGAFLNFPKDTDFDTYLTTRNTASNATYMALPWGSAGGDFLWNVTTPSWSFNDVTTSQTRTWIGAGTETKNITDRIWQLNLNSTQSFFSRSLSYTGTRGVANYPVTSSWRIYDAKFFTTSSFRYVHNIPSGTAYPTFVGSSWTGSSADKSLEVAYPINFPDLSGPSTGSIDKQYFDKSNGAGITRAAVSESLVTASVSASDDTGTGLNSLTRALKSRRLFFPIPISGSGTTAGTDYWFTQATNQNAANIFNENGGIYNIQFTLKRYVAGDLYPDQGSFMTVFIHDVQSAIPSSSNRIPGASGWYPPENNIVTIGNGYGAAPVMSFIDPSSGYLTERFDFNVIQYGYPAQLCFEASGSLSSNAYFGIIIDDIQFCKIGVTTDPAFIKPQTVGSVVTERSVR